jgi:hypothetical protein
MKSYHYGCFAPVIRTFLLSLLTCTTCIDDAPAVTSPLEEAAQLTAQPIRVKFYNSATHSRPMNCADDAESGLSSVFLKTRTVADRDAGSWSSGSVRCPVTAKSVLHTASIINWLNYICRPTPPRVRLCCPNQGSWPSFYRTNVQLQGEEVSSRK